MPRIADALERESRTVDLEQGDFERLLGRRERKQRNRRIGGGAVGVIVALVMGIVLVRSAATSTTTTTTDGSTSAATPRDIMGLSSWEPLETGTYLIDPDDDPSTPLRVQYTVAADGWEAWFGASKSTRDDHVLVSVVTVTNLVRHGCRDHSRADPPVGPTVDDLASALADLAPFRVTSPPTDVTIDGYRGKHLELTVPNVDVGGCFRRELHSWFAPLNDGAFRGYDGPGDIEEFWILDVEGSRLVVSIQRTPGMPAEDVAEARAILDSMRIEP